MFRVRRSFITEQRYATLARIRHVIQNFGLVGICVNMEPRFCALSDEIYLHLEYIKRRLQQDQKHGLIL